MNCLRRVVVLGALSLAGATQATVWNLSIFADGLQEVPPTPSQGIGMGTLTYDDVTNLFSLDMTLTGITATNAFEITATRLNQGAPGTNGPVIDDLTVLCNWNGANGNYTLFAPVQYVLSEQFEGDLLSGDVYLNIHTQQFVDGEIRGNFAPVPEPATLLVLAGGALLLRRRRR